MSKSTDSYLYSLTELSTLLVKDRGLHEGHYEAFLEFQFAAGAVGPSEEVILPGIILGVKGFGIREVDKPNPLSVDASVVNPVPGKKSRPVRAKPT